MPRHSKRDTGSRILPNLYGYDPNRSNWNPKAPKIKLESDFIKLIFQLFTIERLSASSIASKLNNDQNNQKPPPLLIKVFTSDFVLKILKRIEYSGRSRDKRNEVIASTIYDKIVTPETFDLAQNIIAIRKHNRISGSNLKDFPLSGFLVCCSCKETRYYVKYAQSKTRSPYYYHKKKSKGDCISLLDAETVNEVLYAIFIDMFTSKKALSNKYEHFLAYYNSSANHDAYPLPRHPLARSARNEEFKKILDRYYDLIKNGALKPEYLKERIETTIDEITQDKNEELVEEFAKYIREIVNDWYSEEENKKVDLIYQYILSARMISKTMQVKWVASEPYNIQIVPILNEWKEKLESNDNNLVMINSDRKRKLKELFDYLKQLCKKIASEQAKVLFRIADSYESRMNAYGFMLSKTPLEYSYFINVDRAFYPSSHNHYIYRSTESKKIIASLGSKDSEIQPYWVSNRIFAYKKDRHLYFNSSFLHSLPEWFYGYNFEYFKIGKIKICFMIAEGSIYRTVKAFELKRQGKKKQIGIREAIIMIAQNPNAKFVDID